MNDNFEKSSTFSIILNILYYIILNIYIILYFAVAAKTIIFCKKKYKKLIHAVVPVSVRITETTFSNFILITYYFLNRNNNSKLISQLFEKGMCQVILIEIFEKNIYLAQMLNVIFSFLCMYVCVTKLI